jgi:hypothetical protein
MHSDYTHTASTLWCEGHTYQTGSVALIRLLVIGQDDQLVCRIVAADLSRTHEC